MGTVPGGTKLGRYEVVKSLSSGSMAELLLARTSPTDRPILLKYIRPEHAIDGAFRDAFLDQGRRASLVHHANVIEVHEVGREDGTTYLAMEYVHGEDVRKLLARLNERRAKLPVQHILAIVSAVAAGVHHAHEQQDADGKPLGLLHLQIKPSNVLIAGDGTVKVGDFGIVRAALTEDRTELLGGVAGYLAPEVVSGQPVDRRSDVFGIGILMYELATGRRLFRGDNDFLTMSAIVAGDIPPPTRHRGDLPKELEALTLKALARAPEDRFESAGELAAALERFAAKAGVRGSLTTLAGYMKRLFGNRLEPWLVDEEPTDFAALGDFDGSPRGLAVPPIAAMQNAALPDFVTAAPGSPIRRVLKVVAREMPTEQLTLAKLGDKPAPDKSVPVLIPAAAGGRTKAPTRVPATPVPAPSRAKPKTVQIPIVAADKLVKDEGAKLAADGDTDDDTVVNDAEAGGPAPVKAVNGVAAKLPKPVPSVFTEETVRAAPQMLDELNGKHVAPLPAPPMVKREADTFEVPTTESLPPPRALTDSERTAVANPPPMPSTGVPSRTAELAAARDATAIVKPLPLRDPTGALAVETPPRKRSWMLAGVAGLAVLAAIVGVIGFSGQSASPEQDPEPRTSAKPAPPDDDTPHTPRTPRTLVRTGPAPDEELRTAATPRTPRELAEHRAAMAAAGSAPEPAADPATPTPTEAPTPTETTPEPVAATPEPEPTPEPETTPAPKVVVVDPPAPKREPEPIDPAPPLDEKPAKKPTAKAIAKSAPKATAKPATKAARKAAVKSSKPTTVATKKPAPKKPATKPAPKPATKPKWDPNALFPK